MQHTSIPFTLAFGPQGCMAEVKGRVVAVWRHAELPRLFWGLTFLSLSLIIQQIWRELKAQGYPHSDRALRAHLEPLRGKAKADLPEASCLDHFSAKEATWLFICPVDDLDEKEREELATIRQTSETAETIYQVVQEFLHMVRKLQGEQLDPWLKKVRTSHIPELLRFAND